MEEEEVGFDGVHNLSDFESHNLKKGKEKEPPTFTLWVLWTFEDVCTA